MSKIILLLDDEANIRKDLGGFLQKNGFDVHKAENVNQARKIILSEKIDCAIVDLKIDYESEYGGVQIINFIKRIQPRAKAIILSAYSLDQEIKNRLEVEIDGYITKGGQENYILTVKKTLDRLYSSKEMKKCFVIMPFSTTATCKENEWTDIFEHLIKPAINNTKMNYLCERSQSLAGNIIENVLDELNRSELVIADLTDRNPNVYYELGVRHALRDRTILISQSINDIPFDLRQYATIVYEWKTKAGKNKFSRDIKNCLTLINEKPEIALSPVKKYLNL